MQWLLAYPCRAERHCSDPLAVHWLSVSNRSYDVMRGTNLAAGTGAFVPVPGATNLTGTPPQKHLD